jgi:hypothetical protein
VSLGLATCCAAVLMLAAWGRRPAPVRYDVQLAFTGYTGLARAEDCDRLVDRRGYDSLVGTVSGIEPTAPDDDAEYIGTLRRITHLDLCQTTGRRSANDDEQVWCKATLTGAGRMIARLTVASDEGRGARLQAEPIEAAPDSAKVEGSCDRPSMDEIKRQYPAGEVGGAPDGQDIPESRPPRFVINGLARLRVGYFPADTAQDGWSLRVVRGPY